MNVNELQKLENRDRNSNILEKVAVAAKLHTNNGASAGAPRLCARPNHAPGVYACTPRVFHVMPKIFRIGKLYLNPPKIFFPH